MSIQSTFSWQNNTLSLKKLKDSESNEADLSSVDPLTNAEIESFVKRHNSEFPWLIHVRIGYEGLLCLICSTYVAKVKKFLNENQKTFVVKPSTNCKTSALRDHMDSSIHQKALADQDGSKVKLEEGQQQIESIVLSETENLFLTVFFMSSRNIPLNQFSEFTNFLESLDVKLNAHYRNAATAKEFLRFIGSHFRSKVIDQLKNQKSLGLMIDESMDVSGEKYLVINFKTLVNNQPKELFMTLLPLEKGDSESIANLLLVYLTKYELLHKIQSIATDGASVMVGQENGVVKRLKDHLKRPHLIAMHCLSHRLNLGAKDIWSKEQRVQSFNHFVAIFIKVHTILTSWMMWTLRTFLISNLSSH